jgi:hypothetical protein
LNTPEATRVTNKPESNSNTPIERTIHAENRVTPHHPLKRLSEPRVEKLGFHGPGVYKRFYHIKASITDVFSVNKVLQTNSS